MDKTQKQSGYSTKTGICPVGRLAGSDTSKQTKYFQATQIMKLKHANSLARRNPEMYTHQTP